MDMFVCTQHNYISHAYICIYSSYVSFFYYIIIGRVLFFKIVELDAKQKPGPGQYGELRLTNRGLPLQGRAAIKFGQSDRLSELDVLQNRARQTPGPGANGAADGPRPHIGTKFNLAVVPTELDLIERNAKKTPAPHDYGCPLKLSVAGGGQFSTAFPPSSLEEIVRAKKNIPGPASYDPPIPQNKYVGKCTMGRSPGEEDRRLHLAAQIPGPGSYDINLTRAGKTILTKNPGCTKWPIIKRRGEQVTSPKKSPAPKKSPQTTKPTATPQLTQGQEQPTNQSSKQQEPSSNPPPSNTQPPPQAQPQAISTQPGVEAVKPPSQENVEDSYGSDEFK
jgi:hypothetical protein